MTTCDTLSDPVAAPTADALFELQLRVARRADELARTGDPEAENSLVFWFKAEQEILAPYAEAVARRGE